MWQWRRLQRRGEGLNTVGRTADGAPEKPDTVEVTAVHAVPVDPKEAAARAIKPCCEHWDIKSKEWPTGLTKPHGRRYPDRFDAGAAFCAELKRHVGHALNIGQDKMREIAAPTDHEITAAHAWAHSRAVDLGRLGGLATVASHGPQGRPR